MDGIVDLTRSTPTHQAVNQWILIVGLSIFLISLTYKLKFVEKWDKQAFNYLNEQPEAITRIYQYLWPLGTTPVAAMAVMIMYLSSFRSGLISSVIFILLLVIEKIIKINLNRKRPFEALSDYKPSQPLIPDDPSYPSGDAMRLIFIALSIAVVFNLPIHSLLIFFTLGLILSFGRIVLGVHYPLDMVSGIGLGMIGSSLISWALEFPIL